MDLDSSSKLRQEKRQEKREYYSEVVLILFCPFRCLEDLRRQGQTFWDSYLEKEDSLLSDPVTFERLKNMQNWHESFYRSNRTLEEPHFDNDFIKEVAMEEEDDEEDDLLDLLDVEEFEDDDLMPSDEFVKSLVSLGIKNPLKLQPQKEKRLVVSSEEAQHAMDQLPTTSSKREFVPPGRAKLGTAVEVKNK